MTQPNPGMPDLSARLGEVHVGLRPDLVTSRHRFHGESHYIVRDPITFQSHSFTVEDYQVVVALNPDQTLAETFALLCDSNVLEPGDSQGFYAFIMSLHNMGFLNLPISDDKGLYKRRLQKQKGRLMQLAMTPLFSKLPGVNLDLYLEKTLHRVRFVFTRWFFTCWLALMLFCVYLAMRNWHELVQPFNNVFSAGNLFALWATLIGLKVFHEFGHAYACKHFGGHVPEMGIFIIAATPCAYVDATDSWNFSRKWERLVVCFAGMYFELTVAAIALIVWCVTRPSMLHSVAYDIVLLASVTTVLFNINPLMKFDGYYAFCDIVEVPNLRPKSARCVAAVMKRLTLGLNNDALPENRGMTAFLFGFGVCQGLYKISIVLGIATMIASKLFLVGLGLAALYAGMEVIRFVRKVAGFLLFSDDVKPVRRRALAPDQA